MFIQIYLNQKLGLKSFKRTQSNVTHFFLDNFTEEMNQEIITKIESLSELNTPVI